MLSSDAEQLKTFVDKYTNILIVAGKQKKLDSLPASLALFNILSAQNKKVAIYFKDALPEELNFLNLENKLYTNISKQKQSLLITLPKNLIKKIEPLPHKNGLELVLHFNTQHVINDVNLKLKQSTEEWEAIIAVEPTFISFTKNNFPTLVLSTNKNGVTHNKDYTEIITRKENSISEGLTKILKETYEELITKQVANCLLSGIIGATQNFQFKNTSPQTLFSAAYLISMGAENEIIVRYLYKTKSLEFIKLWGLVISKFKYSDVKKVGWTILEWEDLIKHRVNAHNITKIVNELKNNFSEADIFILGVSQFKSGFILLHSPNSKRIKNLSKNLRIPIQHSSLLIPIKNSNHISMIVKKIISEL